MTLEILQPHGFCAGVERALAKAFAIKTPAYCLHAIVHNEQVVADLESRGFIFVESLDDVPHGATVLFSAHGVAPSVRALAVSRDLRVVDATCPFVSRAHAAAKEFASRALPVIIIGNTQHVEVKGIIGAVEAEGGSWTAVASRREASEVAERLGLAGVSRPCVGVVSQTTMDADLVEAVIGELRTGFDVMTSAAVCTATKERQDAVRAFDGDAVLVLGSALSSNTRRLGEVARCRAFYASALSDLDAIDFTGISRLGVTSGASTPEAFFKAAVAHLNLCR